MDLYERPYLFGGRVIFIVQIFGQYRVNFGAILGQFLRKQRVMTNPETIENRTFLQTAKAPRHVQVLSSAP